VYAIVKTGGRQEKVSVGDTLLVDRIDAEIGANVTFPALLLVDGANITSDAKALAGVKVTGEVLSEEKGEKIRILRYKSKTGYRRRQGFRHSLTKVKITEIK
jgi:large subunit ribosomal protein L21